MRIRLKVNADNSLLKEKIRLRQLCNQSFVSLSEESNMHKMLIDECDKVGFYPKAIAQVNDMLCFERMIEAGLDP